MTLATLERNDHLRSGSIQKVCILRRKKCCTFAPLEQNVHFRRKRPQKLQKSSSFTVGKKSDARHSRTEWPFTVPIGTKGICFTMENVLHLRPSRAKRPLSTPTTPEIVVLHERDERFFWTFAPLEQNITFWPEVGPIQQNSRFTREVGRFFVQPSKTPNITDENASKGVQKRKVTHTTWQRPDLFWALKSQYYTGNRDGKLISGRLPKKKRRPRTIKMHKNASPARKKHKITKTKKKTA